MKCWSSLPRYPNNCELQFAQLENNKLRYLLKLKRKISLENLQIGIKPGCSNCSLESVILFPMTIVCSLQQQQGTLLQKEFPIILRISCACSSTTECHYSHTITRIQSMYSEVCTMRYTIISLHFRRTADTDTLTNVCCPIPHRWPAIMFQLK